MISLNNSWSTSFNSSSHIQSLSFSSNGETPVMKRFNLPSGLKYTPEGSITRGVDEGGIRWFFEVSGQWIENMHRFLSLIGRDFIERQNHVRSRNKENHSNYWKLK